MITNPNARRASTANGPYPAPLNPYYACMHADPYCTQCVAEGTVLHINHDIERSSWALETPRKVA